MLSMNFTKFTKYVIIYYVNFKEGNRQSAAKIKLVIMKKEILFSYTHLLERIKYYYEYTAYPIVQFSAILDITRHKAEKLINKYNFVRSDELKHLSRSFTTSKIWSIRSPIERHNIATKGNIKRLNTWNSKSEEEMLNFREIHRHLSSEQWQSYSEEEKEERSAKISKTWAIKDNSEKQSIIRKRQHTWNYKSNEEKVIFANKTSERNRKFWNNKANKIKTSNNISLAWKRKSPKEQNLIKNKISKSQKERISKRTIEQKSLESQRKSISGQMVWKAYSKDEYDNICKQRSLSVTKVWASRNENERQQIVDKMYKTQIKNNSFGKSNLEKYILDFLNLKYDVIYQYKLDTKWFDFAIRYNNKITLLELNGSYWHNYRPFDGSKEHIKEYEKMIQSGERKEAIANTWRYRDTLKLKFCKNKNLNLIVIYCGRKNEDLDVLLNTIEKYLNKGIVIKIL